MLCSSPEFAAMWHEHTVRSNGEGSKRIQPPQGGPITVEYSSFAVDGQPSLSMVIYTPATPEDTKRVKALIVSRRGAGRLQTSRLRGRTAGAN